MSAALWSIALASIPVVHFVVLLLIANRRRTRDQMFGLYAITYLDWLFVPFNALIPLSVSLRSDVLLWTLLPLSGLLVYLHHRWRQIGKRHNAGTFFIDARGLTPEGWVHAAFMLVQGLLIVTAFLSPVRSPWFLGMLAAVATYLVAWIVIIKTVRRVALRSKAEFPFIVLGLLCVLGRAALYLLQQ